MAKHSLKMKVIILNNHKSATRARSRSADFVLGPIGTDPKGFIAALDKCSNRYRRLEGCGLGLRSGKKSKPEKCPKNEARTRRQPYRHFRHERIAYKYLTWAWQMDDEARDVLTRQPFTRYYLMRLVVGQDLTRIALNPKYPRGLASEAELLTLRPELNHIE